MSEVLEGEMPAASCQPGLGSKVAAQVSHVRQRAGERVTTANVYQSPLVRIRRKDIKQTAETAHNTG